MLSPRRSDAEINFLVQKAEDLFFCKEGQLKKGKLRENS